MASKFADVVLFSRVCTCFGSNVVQSAEGRSCRSHGLVVRTSSPRRSSASALSGSASRSDFSRIMQLEIVDSHAD